MPRTIGLLLALLLALFGSLMAGHGVSISHADPVAPLQAISDTASHAVVDHGKMPLLPQPAHPNAVAGIQNDAGGLADNCVDCAAPSHDQMLVMCGLLAMVVVTLLMGPALRARVSSSLATAFVASVVALSTSDGHPAPSLVLLGISRR